MTGETRVALFFLVIILFFWTALFSVGVWPFRFIPYASNLLLYLAAWMIFASAYGLTGLYRNRPEQPLQYLLREEFGPSYRQRVRQSLPLLIAAIVFMPTFSAMKSAIPLFNSVRWDQRLIDLDIALHGQDPWRILQPILGFPIVTSLISMAYHLWILLIYGGTIFFALYVRDRQLRTRYFAAFFSIWTINGVVLATLLASMGPCFLEPLTGNDHFAEQMAYLSKANEFYPVMVIEVQQQLIAWYSSGSHGLGRGISAMPSMHVALAWLFFLAIRQVNRMLGIFFFLFLTVIMVGSVHLAYHYAVDGYLAILVTTIIWVICGKLFPATSNTPQTSARLRPATQLDLT